MKPSRWLSLLVLCAGFLLIVVDMTIVNVALPSIGREMRFTPDGLAWVVNAYLVAFAGLLLLAGRLADLFGGKRIFLLGLALFTCASFACGLANTRSVLIAARFVQGIGGAASSAVILAMIVRMFPEPAERAKAFGIFSFVASAGAAVGLVSGGLIVQAASWHWVFFVNVPLGAAIAVAAQRLLPSTPGLGLAAGADVLGAALVTASLMLGVYAIVSSVAIAGAAAIALLTGFVLRQASARRPMLPLHFFRSATLAGANLVQASMSAAFLSFFFLASLDMERVLAFRPLALGLGFLPVAVAMGCLSFRLTPPLVMRFGAFRVLLAGQTAVVASLVAVALGPEHASYASDLLPPLALLGLGGGLSFPALTLIAMGAVAPEDAGVASGLLNTTGQVGSALGLAVLATLAAARSAALRSAGASAPAAAAAGYHSAWLVSAGLVLITMAITVATLRPRDAAPAATEAATLAA